MDDVESQALPMPSSSMEIVPEAVDGVDDASTRDDDETSKALDATANVNIFDVQQTTPAPQDTMAFMKIKLSDCDDVLLYENNSYTVLDGTDEAKAVHIDNERYANLKAGKGPQKNTHEMETQTAEPLLKTRAMNTDRINETTAGTYVSNYDMFDTYEELKRTVQRIEIERGGESDGDGGGSGDAAALNITTYTRHGDDDLNRQLATSNSFRLSSMVLERILAGNVYRDGQRRYRNMDMPNPLDPIVQYLYRVKLLWTYRSHEINDSAVTCMTWCPSNADIAAIGYGVFTYRTPERRRSGYVCLWNMKNPVNPERFYEFRVPVTAVAFSTSRAHVLAIGFYDGSVHLIDVTGLDGCASRIAISERKTSFPTEPVWQIRWIKYEDDEQLLTVSQDGYVMKYAYKKGCDLIARRQMRVELMDGDVEGIPVHKYPRGKQMIPANKYAQALLIQMHPTDASMYFVGTNEGCLHKCSIYYPHQHMHVLRTHKYGVFCMEFSPWSPKIFLTCGTDWTVRIWIDDIVEPIVELHNGFEPIHCAAWCPSNSTIVASSSRSTLFIWDLQTSCLLPAAMHAIDSESHSRQHTADITVFQFTHCGRSMVIGNEDGCAFVYALEDMPFPPHFQYEALEQVMFKCLDTRNELERQVKRMGYLGYATNTSQTASATANEDESKR